MMPSRSAAFRLLALAFSLGALAGGGVMLLVDSKNHRPDPPDGGRDSYLSRLHKEVQLTDSQRAAVNRVLDQHEPTMDSIVQPVRAALESERQAVRRDIRAVLTPEQITKYDAMLARRDSLRHAREREHGNK